MNKHLHTAPLHVQFALDSVIGSEREVRQMIASGTDTDEILLYVQSIRSKMAQVARVSRHSFPAKSLRKARESAKQVEALVKDL